MYIEMNAKDYIDTMLILPPVPPERSEASRRRKSSSNEPKETVNTQIFFFWDKVFLCYANKNKFKNENCTSDVFAGEGFR